jgi:hypothetical protein
LPASTGDVQPCSCSWLSRRRQAEGSRPAAPTPTGHACMSVVVSWIQPHSPCSFRPDQFTLRDGTEEDDKDIHAHAPLPTERGRRRPRVRTRPADSEDQRHRLRRVRSTPYQRFRALDWIAAFLVAIASWNTIPSAWSLPACLLHCCIVLVQQSAGVPALPCPQATVTVSVPASRLAH